MVATNGSRSYAQVSIAESTFGERSLQRTSRQQQRLVNGIAFILLSIYLFIYLFLFVTIIYPD
jgi:hypothetical protein